LIEKRGDPLLLIKLNNMNYPKLIVLFLLIHTGLLAEDNIEQWRGLDRNGHILL
jgi:hypothetical protein